MVPPERSRPCPDPECGGTAEPEQDGDHLYFECTRCGYAAGYHKAEQPTLAANQSGHCSVGVPEAVRRAASAAMDNALTAASTLGPLLQIGRRPNDPPAP